VGINCAQLTATLVESELFGHTKGAFTGADVAKPGLIRAAHGGTLMLDEIGDLPLPLQAAFLRVLQESEVLPVGATQPVRVDFRVISATHRNLDQLVNEDRFRSDLHARLSGLRLTLPSLRERREDLAILIGAVLRNMRAEGVTFTRDAMRALFLYSWPRNIRELEKALELALTLRADAPLDVVHLPESVRSFRPQGSSPEDVSKMDALTQKDRLVRLLQEHGGNVSAVAREMGVARMQIQRWLKRFGLDASSFRR
jgi:sigma-54 dependent transcriptional regulator, acetoin dehydrogenase operon transcriptional activator AcoR